MLPDTALDKHTKIRLRSTLYGAIDYAVTVAVLFIFAAIGTIPLHVPEYILYIAIVLNAIFIGGIASGLTKRLRDPSLTTLQVSAALAANLFGVALAPQIAYMFVINMFVPLAFASLHFSTRQFLVTGILLALGLYAVLSTADFRGGFTIARREEQYLFIFSLIFVLAKYLAIHGAISRLRAALHDKNKRLRELTARLAELATHDELTGIWNRRQFLGLLADESQRSVRTGATFCVAIIDVDHFKHINDNFGHHTGDEVLRELAAVLAGEMRASDQVARYGGEEFVILMVDTTMDESVLALERIRSLVAGRRWSGCPATSGITISAGVAEWVPRLSTLQVLTLADNALYEAKHAGRNRVCKAHGEARRTDEPA
jgi:diguanylate cyclase